jgi:hypothetical protein
MVEGIPVDPADFDTVFGASRGDRRGEKSEGAQVMKNWLIGALGTALIGGGLLLAYPGEDGRHLCGMIVIIAGLQCILHLLGDRAKRGPEK